MNHVYRLVWNQGSGSYVPAPENVRTHVTRHGGKGRAVAGAVAGAFILASHSTLCYALPTGEKVTAGAASVARSGATMNVKQSSQNVAINWQSFGIGANEAVNFQQPNASAIALNRVLGSDPSTILGQLNANGKVWVLNPNGVLFGSSAQVNVGGLLASTMNISDNDFMSGKRTFTNNGTSVGVVSNQGSIRTADGGYIAFLGQTVRNEGELISPKGNVSLAAGKTVTLDFNGDKLLNIQVDEGEFKALAENKGLIQADGGAVLLTAKAKDALMDTVVNNTGVIQARTVAKQNGRILLLGGMDGGTVNVSGTLDASAPASLNPQGGDGGFIETSGANVKIENLNVNAGAENGKSGAWLIDPANVTIDRAMADSLETALNNDTDVSVLTARHTGPGPDPAPTQQGDITVAASITKTRAPNQVTKPVSLTMAARG
ncbi:MAG: filamentous hemagglutinin N-terminal domain-containing protein, partial [Burkholderiales bacterium]